MQPFLQMCNAEDYGIIHIISGSVTTAHPGRFTPALRENKSQASGGVIICNEGYDGGGGGRSGSCGGGGDAGGIGACGVVVQHAYGSV
eukprot:CAMPEP_0174371692 /NCGR_PEP_ID=MMETSP0811_2-20130205/100707_1 /TAXON_ID=73025 ORGANISM="Eutreptiella gymnastica-like, Strain CCMP1594" /NCGR_SAMPLE_ID=MMETSP0811_2 /ASSEMBLY_ACC=CAM_ASM_000667 /LENGTH=87 /DNA_ID=CAMNT_0015518317 /DNA_START=143 /DNA_END=405 /DNA_ORIENTATION=-